MHTIGYVFLWFAIPLLLVLGLDILVVKRREKKGEALRKRNAELLKVLPARGGSAGDDGANHAEENNFINQNLVDKTDEPGHSDKPGHSD